MEADRKQPHTEYRLEQLPVEEQRSVVGFFALLIKVDKRVNPHLYKDNKATS
jgi:hypothetical protein